MNNKQIAKECAEHLMEQYMIGDSSKFLDEMATFEHATPEEIASHILPYINKATNNQKNENT